MWKQKTGISVSNSHGVPVPELVRLVGRIGFDGNGRSGKRERTCNPVAARTL